MSANPNLKLNVLNDSGTQIFFVNQTTGFNSSLISTYTNTSVSTNSSTGSVILAGGLSVSNTTNATSSTQGGSITIAGGASISQDAYVGGTIFTPRVSVGSIGTPGITVGTLYVTTITGSNLQLSGNVTIGGNLTVLGSTTVLNITTSNQIESNVTSSNIFLIGNLIAGNNSHTLGNIFTTGGNVGINTSSPGARLDVSGTARFSTSVTTSALLSTNQTTTNIVGTNITSGGINATGTINLLSSINVANTVNNYSTTSGALNILGDIVISGGRELLFTNTTMAAPVLNARSDGTRIALWADYLLGIETSHMWFQVPSTNAGYKFYQGTRANLVLASSGSVIIQNTANITSISSGAILVINVTANNILSTNLSLTNITVNNVLSTNLSSSNLITSVATIPNSILNNITSNTIIVTSGGLSATFNSNTIGNIFTTDGNVGIGTTNPTNGQVHVYTQGTFPGGNAILMEGLGDINAGFSLMGNNKQWQFSKRWSAENDSFRIYHYNGTTWEAASLIINPGGNIGIGATNPSFKLDVAGTLNASTSITTGELYSLNQTTTNGVFTNLSSGIVSVTTLTSSNVYSSLGTIDNLVGVNLTSNNLSSITCTISNGILNNITSNTLVITGGGLRATFNTNTIGSIITTGGNVGIGTSNPGEALDIRGNLRIGNSTQANYIAFYGVIGDGPGAWNHTFIGERFYGGTESSELLLFKGNDISTSGPDRIRLFAAEHRFDTYTSAINGTFEQVGTTTSSNRMIITTSGNVGIATITPGTTLDVSGTGRITTSLTTGSLFSTNITSTNAVFTATSSGTFVGTTISTANHYGTLGTISNFVGTNISTTNLNVTGLTAGTGIFSTGITAGTGWFTNSLTAGNFFATNITISSIFATTLTLGTVLITTGITSPNIFVTNLTSTNGLMTNSSISSARITNQISTNISTSTINATGLTAGNINFTGSLFQNGSLYISSQWTTFGTNVAYTTGNVGINTTSPSFALDVNGNGRFRSTAFSINSTSGALVMNGGLSISGTNASSITMGGGLTVAGGISLSQDLYVGGNVYINGVNNSTITGNQVIGNNSGTGTYQVNVTLSRTMSDTSYKIIGSLKSITNNTNVYTVSFTNLTTTSFTANIYRIDALGSGWTDTNLTLSYVVYP